MNIYHEKAATQGRAEEREYVRKIAILLDNHGDDPLFLQEAISIWKILCLSFPEMHLDILNR